MNKAPDTLSVPAKVDWVRRQILAMAKVAPGIRVASSLSAVEVLCALYYGDLVDFDANDPHWDDRDRVILSKGHGSIAMYPILADLGFLDMQELDHIGRDQSRLTVIPEPTAPGIETTNGSLGHGLGVACGIALGLRQRKKDQTVFVLCGDGEMNAGPIWEAVMFAARHALDNIVLIVDDNKRSMLGDQADIMGLAPLAEKFSTFGWQASEMDGHDLGAVQDNLQRLKADRQGAPRVIISHTVKGRGVPELEDDPISHVRVLSDEAIERILEQMP
ncbi:MAG: transketolase [Alphaproteobacteria bacterium]|jgi:transketolase|nr:transketolase [Alphaproteobacteria bacterium]